MAFNPFTLANISCNIIILHPVLVVLFIPLFSPTAAAVVGWWSRRQATTQELTHSLFLPPTTRWCVSCRPPRPFIEALNMRSLNKLKAEREPNWKSFREQPFFYHRILISSSAQRRTAETSIQQRAAKFMFLCPFSAPAPWLRM